MTDRKWLKAGVRADLHERARRVASGAQRRSAYDFEFARQLKVAETKWRMGLVVPAAITAALNAYEFGITSDTPPLHGPDIDLALGVEEPAVDLWELGKLYPSWGQVVALGELTGRWPWRFMAPYQHVDWRATSMRYHVAIHELVTEPLPVMAFTDRALADAVRDHGIQS